MRHFDQVAYMNQNVINFCFLGKIQVKFKTFQIILCIYYYTGIILVYIKHDSPSKFVSVITKHSIAANV